MINKIDSVSSGRSASSVSSSVVRRLGGQDNAPAEAAATRPTPPRSSGDIGSNLLSRADERARAAPEVDLARVNDIKAAMARGEFSIDPKAVARAFLTLESA